MYDRTEGNPLFVEALLDLDGAPGPGLPESLRDLLAASVRRLPEETQAVLRTASAGGERTGHALLAAVTGLGADGLAAALRPAVAGNVLVTDSDGYAFRHALIREVVYDDLLPGEHGRLHTRFAEAIGADSSLVPPGRAAIELAHHTYAAHDMTGALVSAWQAAHEAARGLAHAEQLSMLSRVLELWDQVPDAAQRIGTDHLGVLQETAQMAFDSWENERAMALAGAALKIVDVAAEPLRAAMLLERRGFMAYRLGHQDAEADLRRALDLVPADPPSAERARVLRGIARVLGDSDPDEALAAGREALTVARQVGDVETELQTLMTVAVIESNRGTGHAGEALRLLGQARALAERTGYRALLRVMIIESHLLEEMGEHDRAAEVARGGIASAWEHGLIRTDGAVLALNMAEPLASLGRWDEAGEMIEHALDCMPPPRLRAALRVLAGDVALARGDVRSAAESAQASAEWLARTGYDAQLRLPLIRLQVELQAALGRPAEALSVLGDAVDQYEMRHSPRYAWPALVAGARVCAEAGLAGRPARDHALTAQAAGLLARLRALAENLATIGPVQQAYRLTFAADAARADAACGTGPAPGAEPAPSPAAWDAAAAAWDAVSQPYPRAAALLRAAEAAIAGGDREGGEARLQDAARLADRLGARPLSEEVRLLARRSRIALTPGGGRPDAADAGRPSRAGPPAARPAARPTTGAAGSG